MIFGNSTQAPTNGIPSLTDAQITLLYQTYLGRPPDATELASEEQNALKYSAAGIENQISLRAGNTPGSGIRGDEGQAPLTVQPAVVAHVLSGVPIAAVSSDANTNMLPVGPTGTIQAVQGSPIVTTAAGVSVPAASTIGGFDTTTLLILAAMGIGVFLLLRR